MDIKTMQTPLRKGLLFLALILLLGGGMGVARFASAAAPNQDEQAAADAVKAYLKALAKGDRTEIQRLSPTKPENFYGPFLFTRMPVLQNPRVRGHRGLIDFEGESTDPALSSKGTLVLVRRDSRKGSDAWTMQTIFWKGATSLSLDPFKDSNSDADRAQEKYLREGALKYLSAWKDGDWTACQYMTFDWLNRKGPLKSVAKIRSLSAKPSARPDGSVRVDFTSSVSPNFAIINLLRRTCKGMAYAVKEDDKWKVRRMTVSL